MLSRHSSGTQIPPTDTSAANAHITAASQITHTDTSSANTAAATQIAHTDTSGAITNRTAAPQIAHTDTSSANTNITAAPQITRTDTSSADTNINAAAQITLTDTSSANSNITAAPQITRTDTSYANTNITAAPQITLTDTSSADTNISAATQSTLTDTSSADTNITAATKSQLDTLSGPLQMHSPLWRALRRHRNRLPTVADGCERKRKTWRTQPHPQTPKWNGNPRYAFGKNRGNIFGDRPQAALLEGGRAGAITRNSNGSGNWALKGGRICLLEVTGTGITPAIKGFHLNISLHGIATAGHWMFEIYFWIVFSGMFPDVAWNWFLADRSCGLAQRDATNRVELWKDPCWSVCFALRRVVHVLHMQSWQMCRLMNAGRMKLAACPWDSCVAW